jgi:hypothetical protein
VKSGPFGGLFDRSVSLQSKAAMLVEYNAKTSSRIGPELLGKTCIQNVIIHTAMPTSVAGCDAKSTVQCRGTRRVESVQPEEQKPKVSWDAARERLRSNQPIAKANDVAGCGHVGNAIIQRLLGKERFL